VSATETFFWVAAVILMMLFIALYGTSHDWW